MVRETRSSGNEPVVISAITLISQQTKDSYLTNLKTEMLYLEDAWAPAIIIYAIHTSGIILL